MAMPATFGRLQVIPGEDSLDLSLLEVVVADIQGSQASQLVQALSSIAPLGDLAHLKRVRRQTANGASQLQILLCPAQPDSLQSQLTAENDSVACESFSAQTPAADPPAASAVTEVTAAVAGSSAKPILDSCQAEAVSHTNLAHDTPAAEERQAAEPGQNAAQTSVPGIIDLHQQPIGTVQHTLPTEIAALVAEHQLHVHTVQVPRHAPSSREQWKEWTQLWPISWRKPELTAVTAATAAAHAITTHEEALARQWMARAHDLATENSNAGGVCNAAVVVDPATGSVVAEGRDCTSKHPLQHPIMVAIEAAAARDRRLWPSQSAGATGAPSQSDAAVSHGSAAQAGSRGGTVGGSDTKASPETPAMLQGAHKRQKTIADSDKAAVSNNAGAMTCGLEEGRSAAAAEVLQPSSSHQDIGKAVIGAAKSYLCTGFDCYVLQEPCAMCAMAATHARLRRMTYCFPDSQHGALGGAFRLHGQKSLNHHYQVFCCKLEQIT